MSGKKPGHGTPTRPPDETAGPEQADIPAGATTGPAARSVLRILILEDEPSDAELVQRQLKSAGLDFAAVVVDTKAAFLRQLDAFRPEVILSDLSMPGFPARARSRSSRSCTRTYRSSSCPVLSETKQQSSSSGKGPQTMY